MCVLGVLAACGPATTTTGPIAPTAGSGSGSPAIASPPTPPAAPAAAGACKTGTLSLGPETDYPPPPGASGALASGLLNPDAPIDLVVGGADASGHGTLGVMIGTGDGTFKPPVAYQLLPGGVARSVALSDFDTDEDLDIVTAGGSGTPELFLNNGDGTFGTPVALPPATGPAVAGANVVVRVADIHGDAHPDIVTYAGRGFDVWHDEGRATFVVSALPPIDGLEHGAGLAIADINGDGATDVAVAGTDHGVATIAVLMGKTGGRFAPAARTPFPGVGGTAAAVVIGDFDGDHRLDVAALFVDGATGTIVIMAGTGSSSAISTKLPVADTTSTEAADALVAADLDGDGRTDLAVTTASGVVVYRALAAGGFGPAVTVPGHDLRAVIAGDFRGEHLLGLAATRANGHAVVWPASCQ
jgi:hypothetical protein|nr:VCBS repeat-containing protein [Kofleriaceae bacterium]